MERLFQYALATDDGRELAQQDCNILGASGALSDDHLLSELLRLAPFDGSRVFKAIIPGSYRGISGSEMTTVVQAGTGVVTIWPFRMVVGSRNAVTATPNDNPSYPDPSGDSAALANWRDLRSGVFVGSSTSLTTTLSPAANSSGNPRWDLVYAAITVDSPQNTVVRRQKNPTTGALTSPSVPAFLLSPVTIGIVQGTPGATPVKPSLPADGAGVYYAPLAYVGIPNGFDSSTVLTPQTVRGTTIAGSDGTGSNPLPNAVVIRRTDSALRVRPANGNNDGNNAGTSNVAVWDDPTNTTQYYAATNTGARPNGFVSPGMVGGEEIFIQLDLLSGSTTWSHQNGSIVDNSVAWSNRLFNIQVQILANANEPPGLFATAPYSILTPGAGAVPGAPAGTSGPYGTYALSPVQTFLSNSFAVDEQLGSGNSTVLFMDGSTPYSYPATGNTWGQGIFLNSSASNKVGLYVDSSNRLRVYIAGTPAALVFIWLRATGRLPQA